MMKILSNLRMRTQIIIFQIFVLILVMGLVSTGNLTQRLIFQYAMSASSEQIIQNSDIREIGLASTLISQYIKQRHLRSILLVDHIAQIIYFYSTQEERFSTQYHLDPCVTQQQLLQRGYLTNLQKFCYQIHGTDDLINLTPSGSFFLNCLSLLDNFGLLFNIYNPNFLQIVDLQSQSFDSLYPFGLMIKNYDPRTRQWYKNHVEGMERQPWEQIFFSDIFQIMYAGSSYEIAITQSLINQKKEVLGILKTQLSVSDKDFINSNINILLINRHGQVIYNGLDQRKNISGIFYIYNQSITGFNSTDWYLIEEKAKIHKFQHQNEQYFTLFDKYSQDYVHVHCQKLEKENFTLIIYTNISSIQLMQGQYEYIENKFDLQRQIANTTITFFGLVLCFISIFIIKCICQPLVDLNRKISQHLLTLGNNINQQIFKITYKNLNSTNILTNLNFQFQNFYEILQRNNNKKCEQCRLIEKMKYNLKENNIDLTEINLSAKNLLSTNKRFAKEIIQQIFKCSSLQTNT